MSESALSRIIAQSKATRESLPSEIRLPVSAEKVEAVLESMPTKIPSIFSIGKYISTLYQNFTTLFSELSDNLLIINQNIGKVKAAVSDIPGLQGKLKQAEIDLELSVNENEDLYNENKELKAEVDLKTEILKEIADKDYMSLMQQAIIESTKALRDGRDVDYIAINAQFSELSAKVKSVLG